MRKMRDARLGALTVGYVLMRGDPSAIREGFVHDPDVSPVGRLDNELGCFPLREITQHGLPITFNVTGETSCFSTMSDQVDKAAPGLHHLLAQAIHVEIAPVANDDALSCIEQKQALRHVINRGV